MEKVVKNIKIPNWVVEFTEQALTTIGTLLVAFFTPLQFALWMTVGLVIIDTITGVMKAGKEDISEISSKKGFNKTFPKLIIYFSLIVLAGMLDLGAEHFKQPCVFVNLTLLGIGWIEVRSVDENFKSMFGFSFIEKILEAVKMFKNYKRK